MRHLILAITFFSFFMAQNLEAQTKGVLLSKNEIENRKELKAQDYYSLSDKQYDNLMNLKDKKEIRLKDGSIAFLFPLEEIAVAGLLSREQLDRLSQAFCSGTLAPGDICEGDCRSCPEGYICTSITPSISLNLEKVGQNELSSVKEKFEMVQGNFAVIRPAIKKCIALPSNLRN